MHRMELVVTFRSSSLSITFVHLGGGYCPSYVEIPLSFYFIHLRSNKSRNFLMLLSALTASKLRRKQKIKIKYVQYLAS